MKALRLAINLIRIPRLFLSLLFVPLLVGTTLVYLQLLITGLVLRATHRNGSVMETQLQEQKQQSVARLILFGSSDPLPQLTVCRFRTVLRNGSEVEVPPSPECQPDVLDAALKVKDPSTFDTTEYEKLFNGNVERLLVGRLWNDQPHLVIDLTGEHPRTNLYSLQGLMVLSMLNQNEEIVGKYIDAQKDFESMLGRVGKMYLHLPGILNPVHLGKLGGAIAVVFNILGVVVIALWLALRAHRKVLDYFARNGALLPLVAATGRGNFYGAIWILTLLRVGAFLAAAVPLMAVSLASIIDPQVLDVFFNSSLVNLGLWLIAISASLGLATIVGSIAELKHRHGLLMALYRWVPLIACITGALLWAVSFLLPGNGVVLFRELMTALPVLGTTPILVAPILKPALWTMLSHVVLTLIIVVAALRSNARWFAAHLEDL